MKNSSHGIYGAVQGRLIQSPPGELQWFPQENWESEFFLANALGFSYIELIAEEQHNELNPIWTDAGIERIKSLVEDNQLILPSICNDYIIPHSLLNSSEVVEQTKSVIEQGKKLGVSILVLPLFKESEITKYNYKKYVDVLHDLAEFSEDRSMTVCLETILTGDELLGLFEAVNHKNIKCVFDTGNRIAFGHDIYTDIVKLGDHIEHVHIKDKNADNENVFLGTGLVNFNRVFESLNTINYQGLYTFETTRGKNPLKTARLHKDTIEFFLQENL